MKVAILVLAIIGLVAGLIAEYDARGKDFAGWGVVLLAVAVFLMENG